MEFIRTPGLSLFVCAKAEKYTEFLLLKRSWFVGTSAFEWLASELERGEGRPRSG
jgi:hypothetical protein